MAGVVPGILLALLLMLVIQVLGVFKPANMPKVKAEYTWEERLISLWQIAPVIFIVFLVIGGMYLGYFAPTVGGAIGSAGVLVIAGLRRLRLKTVLHSFYETVLINAQLFPLIIAGFIFSRFIALSGLSDALLGLITGANLHPIALMLVIIIFYLFIGCVLEFMSMAIVTLPIVYPLLTGVGFDPTATIIILVLLSEIALITPPIGLAAFLIAGVAKVPPETVFKGVLPFFITSVILLWLLVLFPSIATWLPDQFSNKNIEPIAIEMEYTPETEKTVMGYTSTELYSYMTGEESAP
jgi:tripartite ATP-independent transporter DctM subunit